MSKFTNINNLDKLSKALNNRCKELIDEEKARAIAEEQILQAELDVITEDLFNLQSNVDYVDEQIENITNIINDFEIENNVKMIAHRGFSSEAPENTIVAYKLAGMRGYWGAECDIQETSDGHLILMHDDTVDRTTNGTGKVSEMTLEQIKALTVTIKAGYYEKVPTLEEYLICCKKYNLVPIIEIKASINIDNFIQIVRDQGMEDKVIVISFSDTILIELRSLSNIIKIQLIQSVDTTFKGLDFYEQYNFDVDINYTASFVTEENIKEAHRRGIEVNTWTVNDTNVMNNLINIGVDYITTDALNIEACEGNRLCKIERTSLTIPEKASLNLLSSMKFSQSDLEPIRFNYHMFTITERRNGEYINTGTNSYRIVSNPIATLGCYYYKIEFDSSICKLTLHPFDINNKQITDLGWFKSNDIYKLPSNTSHFFIYCSRTDGTSDIALTDSEVNAIKSSVKITRMYYSSENDVMYTTSNIKYVNGHPDITTIGNNIGNDDNGTRCLTNTRYNAVSTLVRVNFDSSLIKLTVSSASATNERLADIGWLVDGNDYNLPTGTDWFYIYFAPVNGTSFTDEQKLAVANATVTCIFFEEPIYQPIHDNNLNTEDKTIVGAINELDNNIFDIAAKTIELDIYKADKEELKTLDAITLNGYSLWVGTTAELEAIEERDPNTLYFEIDDDSDENLQILQNALIKGTLSFIDGDNENETSYFNFATITTNRAGVESREFWILINARYDKITKRFKRIDLDNFSFGWQMQASGTYPGEESFGDYINQGINLWKANGRKAYPEGSYDYNAVTEDIGVEIDGSWYEFGYMHGWNNHFMNDSYGGMTIGGNGFEIDGAGLHPYVRVSHGTYAGQSLNYDNKEDYEFAYTGIIENSFHGLNGKDDVNKKGLFFGFKSELMDTNPRTFVNEESTYFSIMEHPAGAEDYIENWTELYKFQPNGNIEITPNGKLYGFVGEILNNTDFQFLFDYKIPEITKDNVELVYAVCTKNDGTKVTIPFNQTPTVSEYGVYGYIGLDGNSNPYDKIIIYVKNKDESYDVNITNTITGDNIKITGNGDIELNASNNVCINGYSIWIGTTEEFEALDERDTNTVYFKVDDTEGEEVVQVDIVDGVLNLTADKYQKTNMLDGTTIIFPTVNRFTEIHLYFTADSNMNISLPDNCKWRVEPNIEEGNYYEIVAVYNTMFWLVNVISYSDEYNDDTDSNKIIWYDDNEIYSNTGSMEVNEGYISSDYILLEENKDYQITVLNNKDTEIHCYDNEKNYLSDLDVSLTNYGTRVYSLRKMFEMDDMDISNTNYIRIETEKNEYINATNANEKIIIEEIDTLEDNQVPLIIFDDCRINSAGDRESSTECISTQHIVLDNYFNYQFEFLGSDSTVSYYDEGENFISRDIGENDDYFEGRQVTLNSGDFPEGTKSVRIRFKKNDTITFENIHEYLKVTKTPVVSENIVSLNWVDKTSLNSTTGESYSKDACATTDFIEIDDSYYYTITLDEPDDVREYYYNSNKEFISRASSRDISTGNEVLEFPEGTKYIRLKSDTDEYTIDVVREKITLKKFLKEENFLYSFGLLSDVHIDNNHDADYEDTSMSVKDYKNALRFLEDEGANFIAYCGDMTKDDSSSLVNYQLLAECLKESHIPNYIIKGNHDAGTGYFDEYISDVSRFTVPYKDDLFIFVGNGSTTGPNGGMTQGRIDYIRGIIEDNPDRRLFLMYHQFIRGYGSGDGTGGLYSYGTIGDDPNNALTNEFIELVTNTPNLIYCHGHSHTRFNLQDICPTANYYHVDGECHDIHVPSCSKPRIVNESGNGLSTYNEGSEGYIVDVYSDKVIFKAIDFTTNRYMPEYNQVVNLAAVAAEYDSIPNPTLYINTENGSIAADGTIQDISGNDYLITAYNTSSLDDGTIVFNASNNSYLDCGLDPNDSCWTAEIYFRLTDISETDQDMGILGCGVSGNRFSLAYDLDKYSLEFKYHGSVEKDDFNSYIDYDTNTDFTNKFVHVMYSCDGDSVVINVNGKTVITYDEVTPMTEVAKNIIIGKHYKDAKEYANMELKLFRFYDGVALNRYQMQCNYLNLIRG